MMKMRKKERICKENKKRVREQHETCLSNEKNENSLRGIKRLSDNHKYVHKQQLQVKAGARGLFMHDDEEQKENINP